MNVVVLTTSDNSTADERPQVEVHGQTWAVDVRRLGRLSDSPFPVRPRAVQWVIDCIAQLTSRAVTTQPTATAASQPSRKEGIRA